jgi:hypothetical protein
MSIHEQHTDTVTIIDVARFMGVELPKEIAWEVGTAVANAYRTQHQRQPPKDLRKKTSGAGSHCFAVYPRSFVPLIVDAITRAGAEKDRQSSLF